MSGCILFWIKTSLLQNTFNGVMLLFWKCVSRIVKISDKQTSYPWYDFLPITKNLFMFSLLCFRCLFLLSLRCLLGPLSVFSICVHFVFARCLLLWFLPIPRCWLRGGGNKQCTVSGRDFEDRFYLIYSLVVHRYSRAPLRLLPDVNK